METTYPRRRENVSMRNSFGLTDRYFEESSLPYFVDIVHFFLYNTKA